MILGIQLLYGPFVVSSFADHKKKTGQLFCFHFSFHILTEMASPALAFALLGWLCWNTGRGYRLELLWHLKVKAFLRHAELESAL